MRVLILTLMLLVLVLTGCKDKTPPVMIELHDGNLVQASAWQGKWVYINYWAEWCKPCAAEIPALNAFAKANPDVVMLGINFDKAQGVDLLRQVNLFHIDYGIVISDIQIAFPHPLPAGLPVTLVYEPSGKLLRTLSGPQTVDSLQAAMQP